MRKIEAPTIKFNYLSEPDTEARFQRAYCRIFAGMREEIIRMKKLQQKGGEQLNMRKYALYVWIPKDLPGDDELTESRIAALKQVAIKEDLVLVKTMREQGENKTAFKEMLDDILSKGVTGILCDNIADIAFSSSLQQLLYMLLFDMGVEIRTPNYVFRSDLPNNRCYMEVSQEGGRW
jgi:hypothetical protein